MNRRISLGLLGSLLIAWTIFACGSPNLGTITSDINGDAAVDAGVDAVSDAPVNADVAQADVGVDAAVPGACGVCGVHATCSGSACTPGFRVFVTSHTYTAQLGGYDGAAQICQTAATTAGLTGTWAAWMSGANQGEKEPAFNFTKGTNYQLLNGTFLAADLGGFSEPRHAIDRDETNAPVAAGHVWTNTGPSGTSLPSACGDMNASSPDKAGYGRTDVTFTLYADGGFAPFPSWAYAGVDPCGTMNALFCFEQ